MGLSKETCLSLGLSLLLLLLSDLLFLLPLPSLGPHLPLASVAPRGGGGMRNIGLTAVFLPLANLKLPLPLASLAGLGTANLGCSTGVSSGTESGFPGSAAGVDPSVWFLLASSILDNMASIVLTGFSFLSEPVLVACTYWPTIFTSSAAEWVKTLGFLAAEGARSSSLGSDESLRFFLPWETPTCSLS